MSDNDSIKRGDAKRELYRKYVESDHDVNVVDYQIALERVPPVPQEMSAREYLKEKARMKATLLEECKKRIQCREPNCHICQWSYRDRVPDGNLERENPQQAIAIVEKWAQEHPEEVKR